MNLPSSLLFSFIRCFPSFSLILFLLLHHFLYPDFLNFQLSVFTYSLCFLILFIESLFLFFYKDRAYPQIIEMGLLFLSAFFLSSLIIIIEAPTALFFVFAFAFIQALSWIFLKKLFQTAVFFIYLSFLFPLFLSVDYQSLEQKSFLILFSLLALALMFSYLFVFYFVFSILNKKTESPPDSIEDRYFFLTLSSDFLRRLKPFLSQVLKHSSRFEEDIKKNKELLKHIKPGQLSIDFSSAEKIKKDLDSLSGFISSFIEYIELFFEKLRTEVISSKLLLDSSLMELENHPKKPRGLNLRECLILEKDFGLRASAEHLKKAFKNIIINAFEAYSSSDKKARLNIHLSSYDGEWLVIHFIDEGRGIEAEEERKLFNPFFSKKFGLGGLGLSYAKKVIELHQGTIQIKREDKKTKVIVRLPFIELRKQDPVLKKKTA